MKCIKKNIKSKIYIFLETSHEAEAHLMKLDNSKYKNDILGKRTQNTASNSLKIPRRDSFESFDTETARNIDSRRPCDYDSSLEEFMEDVNGNLILEK